MNDHKDDNVVVIAPTGSGKTEAALLWLDGEKGFYTLPLKVSSNAIYDRIMGGLFLRGRSFAALRQYVKDICGKTPMMYRKNIRVPKCLHSR